LAGGGLGGVSDQPLALRVADGRGANKADLRKQLTKLLEANPDLLGELRTLLPESSADAGGQHMTLGDNSRAAQSKGDHNTITISG